jgi:hypothetical protein
MFRSIQSMAGAQFSIGLVSAAVFTLLLGGAIVAGGERSEGDVAPLSKQARTIVERLKPDLATFAMYVTYVPKDREERPSVELYAPIIVIHPGGDRFHITDEQSRKIFDWLVDDGYFARAEELLEEKRRGLPVGPYYDLTISVGGQSPMYHASIGWDKNTIARLKAIHARLEGPPAEAVKRMIKAVSDDLNKSLSEY